MDLAVTSLAPAERRVVERLVERLHEELGSDLHARSGFTARAPAERGPTPSPTST